MDLSLVYSFLGFSILLTLMPGPDNIYVLTESISSGAKKGMAISLGLSSGVLIHTLAAASGISLILLGSPLLFNFIKYAGAAYLLYLAYLAFRSNAEIETAAATERKNPEKSGPLVRRGFLMNVMNPKVSLFFMALLPQFISPQGFSPTYQMMILGVIFMLQALLIFCGISLMAGKLNEQLTQPRFGLITKWLKVSVLAVLAFTLLLTEN